MYELLASVPVSSFAKVLRCVLVVSHVPRAQESRLVMLPLESHSYQARESVLHMLWETSAWLDEYVKNAGKGEPDE